MIRCTHCVMPQTRPDTAFVDGVCSACLSYEKRPKIDWEARKHDLLRLLDRHHGECIVPSSGGKDSTWQVLKLIELGAHVTIVTATTCHLTRIGRANIDNLARYAKTIEITPNRTVRAKLNRLGMELVGDISWPEHVSIFNTPFVAAANQRIPLIFYGENPQAEYGGPMGADEARTMTRRWITEFGGHLGLRPADMVGQMGITERDMQPYKAPMTAHDTEAHFLGTYFPWDSHTNAEVAKDAGMSFELPTPANVWDHENLDNAQTGLHDWLGYLKYGYGRGCAQASVDVRYGRMTREDAMGWVIRYDGTFPSMYASISVAEVLDRIGTDWKWLKQVAGVFANKDIFQTSPVQYLPEDAPRAR